MAEPDPRVEVVADLLHSLYCPRLNLPGHGRDDPSDGQDEENARLILVALDFEEGDRG